jgi:hypothetical protein
MIQQIPLKLRSVEVTIRVAIEPCGPACLLATEESFPYALPGGMALNTQAEEEVVRGVLLGTRRGTLIKLKAVSQPSFGLSGSFSARGHERALDILRKGEFAGVCRPERDCTCSLEFRQVEGRIAWTPFSMHAPRLAELFSVYPIRTREQAFEFLRSAWSVLSGLNGIGITHGDPAFYNFLVGSRTVLIDLDQCAYTDETESAWDQSVFLFSTIVPMLGAFMPPGEIVSFAETLMADTLIMRGGAAGALAPATAHAVEHNRTARLLRSLAMRNHALQIQIAETGTKLNERLVEEHQRWRNVLQAAEERGRALEAAHAELANRDAALAEARRQLEHAVATVNEQERGARVLETAAAERLAALQDKDRAVISLHAELANRDAALAEARRQLERAVATVNEQEQRAGLLEAAAAERLAALQDKDRAVISLHAELVNRDVGLAEARRQLDQAGAVIRKQERALVECQEQQRQLDQLRAEHRASLQRIKELEEETWREFVLRRLRHRSSGT